MVSMFDINIKDLEGQEYNINSISVEGNDVINLTIKKTDQEYITPEEVDPRLNRIGQRLQRLRKNNGFATSQLADYLETTVTRVKNIEIGASKLNTVELDKLANLYLCDDSDLVHQQKLTNIIGEIIDEY